MVPEFSDWVHRSCLDACRIWYHIVITRHIVFDILRSGATLALSDILFLAFLRSSLGLNAALTLAINGQLCVSFVLHSFLILSDHFFQAIVPLTIIVRVGMTRAAELTTARKSTNNSMPLTFRSPPHHSADDGSTSRVAAISSTQHSSGLLDVHGKGMNETDLEESG